MQAQTLRGRHVALEPIAETHREALRAAADDARIWAVTTTRGDGTAFDSWFDTALADRASARRLPFAVRLLADGHCIGSTSYLDMQPQHRRLEIGSTWYHPDHWGSAVNPECKLLLLSHAFGALGIQRVGFLTDRLNTRSQAAIAKLGASREGLLRSHMITQGGRVRDSVVFSIISEEWPRLREGLEARCAA